MALKELLPMQRGSDFCLLIISSGSFSFVTPCNHSCLSSARRNYGPHYWVGSLPAEFLRFSSMVESQSIHSDFIVTSSRCSRMFSERYLWCLRPPTRDVRASWH